MSSIDPKLATISAAVSANGQANVPRPRPKGGEGSQCPVCQAPLSPEGFCGRCVLGGLMNEDSELEEACEFGEIPAAAVVTAREQVPEPLMEKTELEGGTLPNSARKTSGGQVFFGPFELLGVIGKGGMGTVWRARQQGSHHVVALKVLAAGWFASPAERRRFQTEIQTLASLRHPHIIRVFEAGEVEGQPYYTMAFMHGGRLGESPLAARAAGLDEAAYSKIGRESVAAARLMIKIARALHHAHQHGIVHRDVKPSNILIDLAGEPHVTDFGLARLVHADSSLTHSGAQVGTPSYMAPEEAAGKAEASAATDIYGLGAVLYELLTGQPPFQGASLADTLQKVIHEDPIPPRQHYEWVHPDLETICLKALAKDPARRYPTAEEMAEDLLRFILHLPISAKPDTQWVLMRRWFVRHRWQVLAAVGLLALGGCVLAQSRENARLRQKLQKHHVPAEEIEQESELNH